MNMLCKLWSHLCGGDLTPVSGLNVCRVTFGDGTQRHIIARLEPVNGGMMFEFHDPLTDEVVGCVGGNQVDEFVTPLAKWIENQVGPKHTMNP